MREIKFRIFLPTTSEVLYSSINDLMQCDVIDDVDVFCNTAVVMQYTGIKDVNGVDIYEGDVVEVQCYCDTGYGGGCPHSSERQQIIWDEEGLKYDFKNSSQYGLADIDRESMEVIGNIYENPELMERRN